MKDLATLLRFLYDSEEDASVSDDLLNLAEQIKTENRIEVKKGPLKKALSSIGLDLNDEKLIPDYGSVLAHFDSAEEYQDAVNKLESPDGMEKLAQLGWVMNLCGNHDPEKPDYRVRFLAIELHDDEPENSQKEIDIDKTMKDVADLFSHDEDDPKRNKQNADESRNPHIMPQWMHADKIQRGKRILSRDAGRFNAKSSTSLRSAARAFSAPSKAS